MRVSQTKYVFAGVSLIAALFTLAVVNTTATVDSAVITLQTISAFSSFIVISLLITAWSHGFLPQDLKTIVGALAGFVIYYVAKSAVTTAPGLMVYASLLLGAITSAALHCTAHSLSRNQST
jgi:hypothetical protein